MFRCILIILILSITMSFCQRNMSPHQEQCVDVYLNRLQDIFSTPILKKRVITLMKSSLSIRGTQCPFPGKVIINTAPGSSGTTSLFLASIMLNITAIHHMSIHVGCSLRHLAMNNLQFMNFIESVDQSTLARHLSHYADIKENPVMLLDTPYSQLWLDYFLRCPGASFIYTDMHPAKWYRVRKDHLSVGPVSHFRWDLTIPIPFIGKQPKDDDVLSIVSLMNATREQAMLAFEAYRTFVNCIIPANQLTFVSLATLDTPRAFWETFISLSMVNITVQQKQELIDAGSPYMGSKGCMIGNHTSCNHFEQNIHKLPGRCRSDTPSAFIFENNWDD